MREAAVKTLFDFCGCVSAAAGADAAWAGGAAGRLALLAHLRDQDDLHLGSLTHPGGVVWSAVVASAGETATLGASIDAAAFGYELTVRIAEAAGPDHRRLWHATATAGTVGAAGAAARLLGADPVDAVAHAASVAGGSAQAMVDRTGTRFLHRSHAAESGVRCARAALAGLRGSRGILSTGRGAFGDLPGDVGAARDAPAIAETGFRLHASNGFAQAAVDAASTLGPIAPREVERVRITVSPVAALAAASNPSPADDEQAWWSIEHAVAVALSTADPAALAAGLGDADVRALCARVELEAGDAGWGASVLAELHGGETRSASVDGPRGHGSRPASDEELVRKWNRLTGGDGAALLDTLREARDDEPLATVLPPAVGAVTPG